MNHVSSLGFKPLAIFLLFSSLASITNAATNLRQGVLEPEVQQRLRAISAAAEIAKEDSLPEPEVETAVDKLEILIPIDAEPSPIEKNAEEALAPPSLEDQILDQSIATTLEQFGYNLFTTIPTTFAPVEGIPVPPDYIVGPGDNFLVQIFSAADLQYSLVVTREGKLLVPEVGDIQVAGLTFEEAKLLIRKTLEQSRMGVKSVVTLANLHTIQIMLVGEVIQPGSYTVSGLSTLVNTLITTGGIKRTGSLRSIEVKRGGKVVATLDLYELLLRGDTSGNIYLRQGDVIFVPPIGPVVSIAGEVVRPAIYEIKTEESVSEIVKLAGGVLPTAALDKTQVERISAQGGYTLLQAGLDGEQALLPIKSGDLIRVFPVINQMDRVVLLEGNVLTPGGYQWQPDMRISDLIADRSILRQGTDMKIALVERENRNAKNTEVIYFNLQRALDAPESASDLILEPRDRVRIFDIGSPRAAPLNRIVTKIRQQTPSGQRSSVVELKGAIRHAGTYPLEQGSRLLNVLAYGGGVGSRVDKNYSLVVRSSRETGFIEFISISLNQAFEATNGDHNPVIEPNDRIYLFDDQSNRAEVIKEDIAALISQSNREQRSLVVEVSGTVKSPGRYPLTPGMRIKDLITAAGGLKEESFGAAATLARQIELADEFSRTDQIPISLTTSDPMLDGPSLVLQPADHLMLRQKPDWITKPKRVTVKGEVIYPGTYEVDKNETLCGLVQKVGGFTEKAYLFGSVFTRESVRQREQEALNRIYRQLDDLLADVHLSPGKDKDTKLPVSQSTLDTFRVIKELQPEKAAGRLVIDVESAVNRCDEVADLLLEDGDQLYVPAYQEEISVVGQVYFPASHQYRSDRGALDYINLSGGTKELAQREHAYIVQANGEVMTLRSMASTWGWLLAPSNVKVTPGSTIYVPLSVDRINGREFAESWVDLVYKLTLSAASVDFLFNR